jgi:branched-chain amino acid transport system ATP-binding protein
LAQDNEPILRIQDLSVSYGRIRAIWQVSLEVYKGEIVALIGANGAGKSTLLAAVLGIQHADSGTILFKGRDITRRSTDSIVASGITLVPEGRGILSLMTVMENLQLGAYQVRGNIRRYLDLVFEQFPLLRERQKLQGGALSGGEQQMLSIARALLAGPQLLMMDEPSLGLAPKVVNGVFDLIGNLKRQGQTILLVEQNARKALQCADRAYVFEVGRIVLSGTGQEILADPRVRQAYLGGAA